MDVEGNAAELGRRPKPIYWVGSSRVALKAMPAAVRRTFGQALFNAQTGGLHPDAKPLKGFGGAGVVEVVESFQGDAFRAVYTVKFAGAVYVLHAFKKKSKRGAETPPAELRLVEARLQRAGELHAERLRREKAKDGG